MKKQKKIKLLGFTLVELMVVIAMIGIMSAISIAFLHSLKTKARLKSAQLEVTATIKTAQSYALQGRKQIGDTVCGYGFRFKDAGNYEIFYNKKSVSGGCTLHYINPTSSKVVFNGKLSVGVTLKTPSFNQAQIFFTLPHANAYDSNGAIFLGNTFVFRTGSSNTKQITINKRALITAN